MFEVSPLFVILHLEVTLKVTLIFTLKWTLKVILQIFLAGLGVLTLPLYLFMISLGLLNKSKAESRAALFRLVE